MQVKYKIKESSIPNAGLGIFADEFIPKGSIVWKFLDENHSFYFSKQALEKKLSSMTFKEAQTYLKHSCDLDSNTVVHLNDDAKYGNHSSTKYNIAECDPDKHIEAMCATRDIEKGEEILENYLASYFHCEWMKELFSKYNVWRPYVPKSKL